LDAHSNIGYAGGAVTGDLNESGGIVSNNSWTIGYTPGNSDFQSVDASQMTEARQSDGSLPNVTVMRLVSGDRMTGLGCF
jgi:hypothetical protein